MVRRATSAGAAPAYDLSSRPPPNLSASLTLGARATAYTKRQARKALQASTQNETPLLQDFSFPTLSTRVKVSSCGSFLFASGTYPPQIHIYDTRELSLKYKRHVDSEITDFQILSSGYEKFALLTGERSLELHTPFGKHFGVRVPTASRDLLLHRGRAEMFVAGKGREVWRLNLHQGRFLRPITTVSGARGVDAGNNVAQISPVNSLLYFGGTDGIVDIWDSRIVGKADVASAGSLEVGDLLKGTRRGEVSAITALRCDERDGVSFAAGTSHGVVGLFDLRMRGVVKSRNQGNGLGIRSVRLHESGKYVVSADAKSVKVWERSSQKKGVLVALEPDALVNHVCCVGGSGVMCVAVEAPRVRTYYVPALGQAPSWCAFLDAFTEELEGGRGVEKGEDDEGGEVYENYRFVGKDDIEGLGLAGLVGTDMMKAYMHGYFVHAEVYRRAVETNKPFAYEEYRKERAKEKMEKERENRISKKRKKVKVNQKVVDKLREERNGKKGKRGDLGILGDDRFKAMFENKDFAVDEDAERFQHLNPSGEKKRQGDSNDTDSEEEYLERFDLIDDGGEKESEEAESSEESDSSDEEEEGDEQNDAIGRRERRVENGQATNKERKTETKPKMYELGRMATVSGDTGLGSGAVGERTGKKMREQVPLSERLERMHRGRKDDGTPQAGKRGGRRRRR